MFIPWESLTAGHLDTSMCKRVGKRKCYRIAAAADWEIYVMEFRAQYHMLDSMDIFKCLVLILLSDEIDWP